MPEYMKQTDHKFDLTVCVNTGIRHIWLINTAIAVSSQYVYPHVIKKPTRLVPLSNWFHSDLGAIPQAVIYERYF